MQTGDIVTIKVVDEGADESDKRLDGKMGIIDTIDRARYRDWETDRKSTRLNSSH